jgi:4-amino-4-deoxy-L-arabinose transferase-like glycosyltransferase
MTPRLAALWATPARRFALLLGLFTAARIASLIAGAPNLGPDEGQYWFWSQTLAFGYFSKPPLVAWSIALTTSLFGEAEWAVRLSAPLYQAGAAAFLFLLCRRLADARAGFWAGAAWLTLPGVALSSALITTDAPLIFFWSAALYAFFELTAAEARNRQATAVLLGAAIGLGLLSKYAMLFFVLGAAAALIAAPERRRRLRWSDAALTSTAALAVIAPNLAWNAAHDFQTIAHTAANANWTRDFGHPGRLLRFLGDQFGVAGLMLALILAAALVGRRNFAHEERQTMRALIAFAIPAFLIVSAQSFISRAHANWAAVAYPSAIAIAVIWALKRPRAARALQASVAAHALLALGFLAAFINADVADAVGAAPAFRKLRGWDSQGAAIAAASLPFDAIMTDDREVTGALVYYARDGRPIVAWNSNRRIDSHFEAFHAYDPSAHRRVLYVSSRADALYIQGQFRHVVPLGAVDADIGRGRTRPLYLFDVSGFTGP